MAGFDFFMATSHL